MKRGKLENKVTRIVRRDSTFADLVKNVSSFPTVFDRAYNEKFAALHSVDIVRDIIGSHLPKGMTAQSYYRYTRAAKMLSRPESILALVESLNEVDDRSRRLDVFHFDDTGL